MAYIAPQNWKKWLNDHPSRRVYDAHPTKVLKLCNSQSNEGKFAQLSENKNIVLLTKSPLGKKFQTTFMHSRVGIPIVPEEMNYVARVNMTYGSGVELNLNSLFRSTSAKHVPPILELMKVASSEEFEQLAQPTTGARKRITCYATLPPAIAAAFQETTMAPSSLFMATVNYIKASTQGEENTDDALKRMGEPFKDLLWLLWGGHHIEDEILAPPVAPLTDEESVAWEKSTHALIEPPKHPGTIDLTRNPLQMNSGDAMAMTKLAESMIAHQEAALKQKEEKSDSRMKAWNRLPQIQKNVILLAGVEEDGTIHESPTEEMLSILGCQNGAQVDQYLKQSMVGHNISPEPGLCSAINKGILVHADDGSAPKNFTAFLVPPVSDDDDLEENTNLLRLAVQDKFSDRDVTLLTKQEITLPMKTQELRHHLKNIAGLAGRCFGQHCVLFKNLQDVAAHIEQKEISYNYEFRQDHLFGGNLLDRIHWRMHRFFDSCASGKTEKIEMEKLDFSDIMDQVERREYVC